MIGDYGWGLWFFARGLALVYIVAFVSLLVQIKGLLGKNGILPVQNYLRGARRVYGAQRFVLVPTVFWWKADDFILMGVCAAGALVAALAFAGFCQGLMFFLALVCYLSLETVGQDFLSFQWDVLLLEAGFLGIFLTPFKLGFLFFQIPSTSNLVVLLLWWLLFRLNFSSGVVKISSGDLTWRKYRALDHHYETQPLPNRAAWFMHQGSAGFKKFSVGIMFLCELVLPFFIFAPQPLKLLAFAGIFGLQILIQLTGNYGFFNLLTMVLCLSLLDDGIFRHLLPTSFQNHFVHGGGSVWVSSPLILPLAVVIVWLSLLWLLGVIRPRTEIERWIHPVLRFCLPFKIANTYGLFAVMTTSRPEIVIEGSDDGKNWRAYEFKWKAGSPAYAPRMVAPHQPRLDWQMWFAAFNTFERVSWIQNLFLRLLEGRPEVLALLKENPFPQKPPRYLRALLYDYHFTSKHERAQSGYWWKRELLMEYSPILSLSREPLKN